MAPGGEHLGGTEGMSEARDAFAAAMDAETPSRSKDTPEEKKPQRMDVEDLFPRREMDRREKEGGADDEPELVKRARAAAVKQQAPESDEAPPPREPQGNDDEEDNEEPDEQVPDEDEDEDEPEAARQEEEEPPEAQDTDELLRTIVQVNIDGQPADVTIGEAIRGYIRTETFHQRLGALQQGVTQLQTERSNVEATRQAYVERADALLGYVNHFFPKEPNWDELYKADPVNAMQMEREWRGFKEKVQALATTRSQAQAEVEQEQLRNLYSFAEQNRVKLAAAHPEWKSEKTWKRDHDSMRRTARSAGYTDQEIDKLYDARGVEILLKASKWDRMMASKPRPVPSPTKRPGTTPSRNVSRGFDRAEKRLSRTGTVSAAADVFERILDREG